MGSLRKTAGGGFLVFFVGMLALRPLLRNPAVVAGGVERIFQWPQVLFYTPLLLVTGLVFVLAVLSLVRGEGRLPVGQSETRTTPAAETRSARSTRDADEFWEGQRRKKSVWEESRDESGDWEVSEKKTGDREKEKKSGEDREESDSAGPGDDETGPASASRFLSGQGGARDKDFEIEEEPPDAKLSEHLDHLRTELGDDVETRNDLDTLEAVVEETEDEDPLPPRCPQEHCNAAWTARTMFGVKTGRYEILDGGDEVICLRCESIYRLDERAE